VVDQQNDRETCLAYSPPPFELPIARVNAPANDSAFGNRKGIDLG
jgi:hypothetical protein